MDLNALLKNSNDFVTQVSALCTALKQQEAQRWLLFDNDFSDFSVAFFALLCAGKHIVLPPSDKPGQLQSIASQIDATIGHCRLKGIEHFSQPSQMQPAPCVLTIDPDATLDFFTSGSTGTPKRVRKCWRQLATEVQDLQNLWGDRLQDCKVLSTVSHQHIYGLLFKLLWPILAGRTIHPEILHYPEELEQQLKDSGQVVLISSPAFLSRTTNEPLWQQYKDCLTMVFSSGGPLQQATAKAIAEQTGEAPVEVLGSTETGGIAWRRQQHQPPYLWQPFGSVAVKLENDSQRLLLKSPYLFVTDWYLTDDRVEITADGKFELLGRFDRVVKIEEKRLSLDELEQQLLTHPYVQQCKAVVLTGKRTTIGCAVELTQSGKAVYNQQDKRILNETLKGHLSQYFEAVQLPRKWRYLDLMPCNSQGKIQQQHIAQLFEN